jgi:hypothetical protein
MPIVRIDIPEGHPRERLLELRRRMQAAIERTWARDHIYIAIRETVCDAPDGSAIVTVDLRPGRGKEADRAQALYAEALAALRATTGVDEKRFVLLVRQFPEWSFVVDGGRSLPGLDEITPELAAGGA